MDANACEVIASNSKDYCRYCRLLKCLTTGMRTEDVKVPSRALLRTETTLSFLFTNDEEIMLKSRMDQVVKQQVNNYLLLITSHLSLKPVFLHSP